MMKKRNTDGFALIYVVVVIFILCAIALALMSSTLRTLQAQEASIRRMEQKYAAQGEIERLVAELEQYLNIEYSGTDIGSEAIAISKAESHIVDAIDDTDFVTNTSSRFFSIEREKGNQNYSGTSCGNTYMFHLISAIEDSVSIHATVTVSSTITVTYHPPRDDANASTGEITHIDAYYSYSTKIISSDFTSYEILGGDA